MAPSSVSDRRRARVATQLARLNGLGCPPEFQQDETARPTDLLLLDEESRVGHLATFLRAHGTIERVGPADVARSVGTVIGTVASEIAGERVLQPNSPASMVSAALQSSNMATFLRAHGTIERVGPADVARSVGA
jgi:hypothetical protein